MLEAIYRSDNGYIRTYRIYDKENHKFLGQIEHHYHCKKEYYIGWKFKDNHFIPDTYQTGKTKMFDTWAEAEKYVQEDFDI